MRVRVRARVRVRVRVRLRRPDLQRALASLEEARGALASFEAQPRLMGRVVIWLGLGFAL